MGLRQHARPRSRYIVHHKALFGRKVRIRKIFIDMDGVLADFDGWKNQIALTRPEVMDDKEGLWEVALSVSHFYYMLDPMPEALEMMEYLEGLNIPLAILTALPRRREIPYAEEDKREWIKDFINPTMEFRIGPYAIDKQNHCEPGFVLIDDNEKNIAQWNARGGIGIFYKNFKQVVGELSKHIGE
jgi:hypothetical protein